MTKYSMSEASSLDDCGLSVVVQASAHRPHRVVRFGRGAVLLHQGDTNINEVMIITKGVCR